MAFEVHKTIRLSDTDAAGRVFAAHYIRLAHDVYEEWLTIAGIDIAECISGNLPALPSVHLEADFSRPVAVGEMLRIQVLALQSGTSSFETSYQFLRDDDDAVAEVRMKHVAVSPTTGRTVKLPKQLVDFL